MRSINPLATPVSCQCRLVQAPARPPTKFFAGESDARSPLISPLYGDSRGLPPILVHASHDEVLPDGAIRVAHAARNAGVEVELQRWRHVPHVWQFFATVLPQARHSLNTNVRFIRARM